MKRIFATAFVICVSCQSLAAIPPSSLATSSSKKFYLGIGAGDMFYRVSGDNYLGTGTGWPNDHYSNNGISSQPYGFLAAGYTWQRPENWLPNYSLGLRYTYVSAASVSGSIDQYSLPAFNNYHYSYDLQIVSLLAIFKADLYRWHHIMPYVLLGAGVADCSTSDYSEQALINVTPRVNPGFENNSSNNFAYQLGVGIDYAIQENLLVNIEYSYLNDGTIHTGNGTNYVTATGTNYDNESLKNKITATTLLLGLTYYME